MKTISNIAGKMCFLYADEKPQVLLIQPVGEHERKTIDKRKARRNKWRVPEAALIWLALLGGSIGAWLGMNIWHHKTQHKKFKYGLPFILLVQIALIVVLI